MTAAAFFMRQEASLREELTGKIGESCRYGPAGFLRFTEMGGTFTSKRLQIRQDERFIIEETRFIKKVLNSAKPS